MKCFQHAGKSGMLYCFRVGARQIDTGHLGNRSHLIIVRQRSCAVALLWGWSRCYTFCSLVIWRSIKKSAMGLKYCWYHLWLPCILMCRRCLGSRRNGERVVRGGREGKCPSIDIFLGTSDSFEKHQTRCYQIFCWALYHPMTTCHKDNISLCVNIFGTCYEPEIWSGQGCARLFPVTVCWNTVIRI